VVWYVLYIICLLILQKSIGFSNFLCFTFYFSSSCLMWTVWQNIKKEFPIFWQYPGLIYLDNAATTQKPQSVIDAMSSYQEHSYANIHRWVYHLAEESERLYKASKIKIAQFIGWDFREIVYTYNATYASNILAQSLVQTYTLWQWDVVLLGIRDHHATIVPWQLLAKQKGFEVQFVVIDKETWDIDRNQLQKTLDTKKVKAVTCSHVSNVTWIVYDMHRIQSLLALQSEKPFFAIDGSQAVPHMRIDVKTLWCDAYFFTGHKMMWPTGIGVLWIDKLHARRLETTFGGWGIIESVTTDWCSLIRTADKFEPWTPNLIGAIWLWAACDFYNENNIYTHIQDHENNLYNILRDGLWKYSDKVSIFAPSALPRCGILSCVVSDPFDFSEYLAEYDICVRSGGHCAHPLLHYMDQDTWVVRISPFVYTSDQDIAYLLAVIATYFK